MLRYFPGFMQSDFHCKHQIDILTGTQVQLADVLYNEAALFYFMEVSVPPCQSTPGNLATGTSR